MKNFKLQLYLSLLLLVVIYGLSIYRQHQEKEDLLRHANTISLSPSAEQQKNEIVKIVNKIDSSIIVAVVNNPKFCSNASAIAYYFSPSVMCFNNFFLFEIKDDSLEFIVLHEMAHIKHKHSYWNIAFALLFVIPLLIIIYFVQSYQKILLAVLIQVLLFLPLAKALSFAKEFDADHYASIHLPVEKSLSSLANVCENELFIETEQGGVIHWPEIVKNLFSSRSHPSCMLRLKLIGLPDGFSWKKEPFKSILNKKQ